MDTQLFINILLVLTSAYLLGSISFGVIMGKIHGVDLLKKGSKSTGTTNAIRTMGLLPGLIVLAGDLLKGSAAAYIGLIVLQAPIWVILAGIFAMIGHSFSIFLKFKGGKSAATGVGIILIINWQVFLIITAIVILIIAATRYQSLGTLIGSCLTPVILYFFKSDPIYVYFTTLAVALIWVKHIPNIKRLLKGTENKIGNKV
jgi:acyl phosphate:glycerol-3-phosphate acyltransferase